MRRDSILSGFVERRQLTPQAPFAQVLEPGGWVTLTLHSLYERAVQWAMLLRARGCRPGDVVIVILEHGVEMYPAYVGAMLAGCVPSFMPFLTPKQDPALYWPAHDTLFRRIDAAALITYAQNVEQLRRMIPGTRYHLLTAADLPPFDAAFVPVERGGDDVALLQHSSGTTGLKRGVTLSHAAILAQVSAVVDALGHRPGDAIASWLPLYHDMGLIACFVLPLVRGGPIISLDAFEWTREPASLLRAIERYRARWAWLPNFAFNHLARLRRPQERYDLSSMRAFINGGEPCRASSFDLFAATFAADGVQPGQLCTAYGMAETVLTVTQSPPGQPVRRLTIDREAFKEGRVLLPQPAAPTTTLLSVGRVIDGLQVCILAADDAVLPDGVVGQIAVTGRCLFSGYYLLEEDTRRSFRGEWFRTGDLGFTWQGELYVTGRIKDVIIVHGKNYYAHDIEALALDVEGVKAGRAVATGIYNPRLGSEDLVLICETTAATPEAVRDLAAALRAAVERGLGLGGAFVHLVAPGWLVKTTSGKISRSENAAKYLREQAAAAAPPDRGGTAAEGVC